MANKDNKRGFSGLSDLASDVSGVDDVTSPEPSSSPPKRSKPTTTHTASTEIDHKAPGSQRSVETAGSGKSGGGSGWKWIFGIIAVFFVIWIANNWEQITKKTLYNPSTPAPNYNIPQSKPASVKPPNKNQHAGLKYKKPSVGTNRVLSVPQIRWCLREEIRLETIEDFIDSDFGVKEFNRIVNDYNSRCGSFRYRRGSLKQAQRDVEADRSQIIAKAFKEAGKFSDTYRPKSSSVTPGKSTRTEAKRPSPPVTPGKSILTETKRPSPQFTREAQKLLTALGYDPGPVDGLFGRRTANSVKAFQRDAGLLKDGWIDEDLLNSLRKAKTFKETVEIPPTPQRNEVRTTPTPSTPVRPKSSATAKYFTRGSHQDDVIRIQGTPSSIDRYSDHEVWKYGYSSVEISGRDRRVTEWNNISGNLKVKLSPGSNVTSNSYYTRGSHQDDVIRIQGTPSSIDRYSDHEVWKYGYSSVEISGRDRRVTEWNNISGNLKVKLSPGSNVTSNSYYTRGSHQDDVIRIQGTPSSIDRYSDHEVWKYGYSSVEISGRDRRVTEWNNISGNLKVKLSPGSNVTSNSYYTRGSHQDDVIRIQGTPSSIDRYSDHEVWKYGYSSVEISGRDRRVTEWNNISGNLKVR